MHSTASVAIKSAKLAQKSPLDNSRKQKSKEDNKDYLSESKVDMITVDDKNFKFLPEIRNGN